MSSITGLISGGGGGTPVNSIARLGVGGQTQYTDESGGVWLKTGQLINSDESTYPDAYVLSGDIASAVYDNLNPQVPDIQPYSFTFSSDGLKVYNTDNFYDRCYQQSLTTPFDLSTLVSSNASYYDYSAGFQASYGMDISTDGTRVFFIDSTNNIVRQYNLSTPNDITTASFAGSFSHGLGAIYSLNIHDSGNIMYLGASNSLWRYDLSTANDITTATANGSANLNKGGLNGVVSYSAPTNPDGTKLYIADRNLDAILQYSMTTPFDLTTLSYTGTSFSIASQNTENYGIYVNADLSKIFMLGSGRYLFQYSMSDKMGVGADTGTYDYVKLK